MSYKDLAPLVTEVAERYAARFPVDIEDLTQELWVWLLDPESEVEYVVSDGTVSESLVVWNLDSVAHSFCSGEWAWTDAEPTPESHHGMSNEEARRYQRGAW